MRLNRFGASLAGVGIASALVLTGCATGGGDTGGGEGGGGGGDAIVTTNGNEPQNPLITTNTTEVGGGKILTSIYAGLVTYQADGSIENDVAESIESEDNINWTVTIRDGLEFTDGTPVTSQSFVDAWNYGADGLQSASYFFDNIVGYDEVVGEYDAETSEVITEPTADEMSGLVVEDETTFTVELSQPEADWPLRLGYTAYMPLPEAAFEDTEAFGENPVGNGPYMLAREGAWEHDVQIELVANPDYDGPRQPENGGLTIIFYADQEAAYADVQGGNLDVLDAVPDNALAVYEDEFPDRSVNQPAAIFQGMNLPYYNPRFAGEEGVLRRQAISQSIDRDEITEVIFEGTRTPATDFTSPVIDGYSDSLEGAEVLEYNPEAAVEAWEEANAINPWGDTVFDIAYNADGGHQAWVDAATQSIGNTLGITAQGKPYPTFAEALTDRANDALTGATRAGWQGDYPSLYNFLAPLYQTGAGSNYEDYSSEEFDQLLVEGQQAESVDDAVGIYQDAQEVLLQDLPTIPLWYSNVNGVWTENVENVEYGWDSVPLYHQITKE